MIQQGDVLIKKVKALPEGAEPTQPKNGRIILADGETTGHAHATLATPGVTQFMKDGKMYLQVGTVEPIVITHEEHNQVIVPPGIYEVEQVKEYDHFAQEVRRVID